MKTLLKILSDFGKRGGAWFFVGSIGQKGISFLISVLIIRAMTKAEYGNWVYALTIVSVVFPFKALGLESSLMRFGSQLKSGKEKYNLFVFSKKQGLTISLFLAALVILIAPFISKKTPDAYSLAMILACWLPSSFILESKQSYYRLIKDHKRYAISQILQGLLVLILGYISYWQWGSIAFALCFALAPAVINSFFKVNKKLKEKLQWSKFSKKSFYSYGLLTGISMAVSQFLFYIDVFLIQNMLDNPEEPLAIYRSATLIPLNLTFIAIAFVNNDFVHISENGDSKSFLVKYLKNYYKLFGVYAVAAILIFLLPAEQWVKIFGPGYAEAAPIFSVLVLAILGSILLRIPAGNVLSAIGLVKVNSWISYLAIIINAVISYLLILEYGIIGAAYGTAITFWGTGIFALTYLIVHIRKLPE